MRQLSKRKQSISQTSLHDQKRQLLYKELEKKALFLITTIKVLFSLAEVFSTSPISLFLTKYCGKDYTMSKKQTS